MTKTMKDWTACGACNRGGNGNDTDKCACGWQVVTVNVLGCFIGTPIVGPIKPRPKVSRSQARYLRYLECADLYESFREFLRDDALEAKAASC